MMSHMLLDTHSPRSFTSTPSEGAETVTWTCAMSDDSLLLGKRPRRGGVSSKFRGVSWFKANQVWKAQITVKGKYDFLGYFDREEDAAFAYDLRALEILGDDAQLNFPEKVLNLDRTKLRDYVPEKAKTGSKRKRARPDELSINTTFPATSPSTSMLFPASLGTLGGVSPFSSSSLPSLSSSSQTFIKADPSTTTATSPSSSPLGGDYALLSLLQQQQKHQPPPQQPTSQVQSILDQIDNLQKQLQYQELLKTLLSVNLLKQPQETSGDDSNNALTQLLLQELTKKLLGGNWSQP